MRKKIISIVMCLVLLLGISMPVHAVENEEPPDIFHVELDRNGERLTSEDTITVRVKLHIEDMENWETDIVKVELLAEGEEPRVLEMGADVYNTETGEYELTIPAVENDEKLKEQEQKWYIGHVFALSTEGQELSMETEKLQTTGEDTQPLYWYEVAMPKKEEDSVEKEPQTVKTVVKQAVDKEKCKIGICYSYTCKDGEKGSYIVYQYVDNDMTVKEVVEQAKKEKAPESYPGMQFQQWTSREDENNTVSPGMSIFMEAEYDKVRVVCKYDYMDAEGEFHEDSQKEFFVNKDKNLLELHRELENQPMPSEEKAGIKYDAWRLDWDESLDGTETIGDYAYAGTYARSCGAHMNDKGILFINYTILGEDGKTSKTISKIFLMNLDTTYKEAYATCIEKAPKGIYTGLSRTGWDTIGLYQDDDKVFEAGSSSSLYFYEKYEGYKWVSMEYYTVDKTGENDIIWVDKLYPNNTSCEEIIKDGAKTSLRPQFEGIRFTNWKQAQSGYSNLEIGKTLGEIYGKGIISYEFEAENCLVQYLLAEGNGEGFWGKGVDLEKAFVVEKGTRLILPKEVNSYTNIEWDEGKEVVAQDNIEYYCGYYNVFDLYPDNLDILDPDTTRYQEETIRQGLLNKINSAAPKQVIEEPFGSATILEQSVLEAMQGKDVTLTISMENGMEWSLNGKSVQGELKDTNLLVTKYDKTAGTIPEITVNKTAGELPGNQLDLVHNGEFSFEGTLKVGVDNSLDGNKAVLLWHNNGTMEWIDSAIIENGQMELELSHASEYLTVYCKNGDVDKDKRISVKDLQKIVYHLNSKSFLEPLEQGIADVDMNNKLNIKDLQKILYHLNGKQSLDY